MQAASSSEAEISDSDDDSNDKRPGIKLKIKGKSSTQARHQNDSGAQDSAAELSRAQKVVKGVLKLKAAAPFSRPVNEEEVPGYGAAVEQPMDLGTVSEKLKNGGYRSLGKPCCAWSRRLHAMHQAVMPCCSVQCGYVCCWHGWHTHIEQP